MSLELAVLNQPVTTAVHVFVAPVERSTNRPTIFDPGQSAGFEVDNPPAPWVGLGRVEDFERTAVDESTSVQSGTDATVVAQFRRKLEAHVSFTFRCWGKLQIGLGTGGVHWNVLETRVGGDSSPTGGDAIASSPVLSGSTAALLKIDPLAAVRFAAGDLIAVDVDYQQQSGYVGLGFPGAYVAAAHPVALESDFIRRVTFNVGRITSVSGGEITLESPLPAGDPPTSAAVQKVVGFADREGGAFRQEWSALFVEETVSGGKVFYYYPRLQSLPQASEKKNLIAGDYRALLLRAHLLALPTADPQDGTNALWYRTYLPPES